MNAKYRIELFGGLRVVQGDRAITQFRTQKTGSLLAYLAFYPHKVHSREILIETFWPGVSLGAGRNNLSVALSSLRQLLEPVGVDARSVLRADRFTVQIEPSAICTDVSEFEAALRAPDILESARCAVDLYRGELLAGYYEEWIGPEQHRLAEQYFCAVQRLLAHLMQLGLYDEAFKYVHQAVAADPLREEFHIALVRLLAERGRFADALRQYRQMEHWLDQQLGETPSPPARALLAELQQRCSEEGKEEILNSSLPIVPLSPRPSGTVTLLFAQIETDAARLAGRDALLQCWHHDRSRMTQRFQQHGGQIIRETVEGFVAVFSAAAEALTCVLEAQQALREEIPRGEDPTHASLKLQMALHTGDIRSEAEAESSPTWAYAQRLLAAGYGGQILCSETTAALVRPELGPVARLADLGLYRLQEEAVPERLFQVEWPDMPIRKFPPLKAAVGYAGRLPLELTRFFGRTDEIAHLKALLVRGSHADRECRRQASSHAPPLHHAPTSRLITLIGPGGSGKTRLAVAVAERLVETFCGAVWFVPLADLTDARRIGDLIADCLRLLRSPLVEPLDQVVEFLNGLRIQDSTSSAKEFGLPLPTSQTQPLSSSLLVLDNFEHLVEDGAAILQTLLERVPSFACLVTSRRRLGIRGEREFRVTPLPVPTSSRGEREKGRRGDKDLFSAEGNSSSQRLEVKGGEQGAFSPLLPHSLSPLLSCPSVQLFVDRAQAAHSDFQLTTQNASIIVELCRRLEGIPLALELAAAHAAVMSPEQMLARLCARADQLVSRQRSIPARQRTLHATMDWSYELLTPELQQFFAQLSVFRGGWTLEAAEFVCGVDEGVGCRVLGVGERQEGKREEGRGKSNQAEQSVQSTIENRKSKIENPRPPYDVLDFLAQLRDSSLIQVEETNDGLRFRMLEMLREYAGNQLSESGRTALRQRHLDFFLAFAETALPHLKGPEQVAWLNRLETEHDNLRAALAWSLEKPGVGYRVPGVVSEEERGRGGEGEKVDWREETLSSLNSQASSQNIRHPTPDTRHPSEDGLRLTGALQQFWWTRGHLAEGRKWSEVALAHPRAEERTRARAKALDGTGVLARMQGDYAPARAYHEESLAICREIDDTEGIARSLNNLGVVARHQGDYASARAYYEESLVIHRKRENRWGIAGALNNLGNVAQDQGDYAFAQALYEEALVVNREIGNRAWEAHNLNGLGNVAHYQGDYAAARRLYEGALAVRQEVGDRQGCVFPLNSLATLARVEGDYTLARDYLTECLVLCQHLGLRRVAALCLENFAALVHAQGQPEHAAWLYGAAAALRERIGAALPPENLKEVEPELNQLRATLGEMAFDTAFEAGGAMDWEQAIASALEEEHA